MAVPEAPVNEDDLLVLRENQVRATGEARSVKAESVTKRKCRLSHRYFRTRILAADASHQLAALLSRENISHRPSGPLDWPDMDTYRRL